MTTTSNLTTTYSLHTEEDLIALVLHQFGYWPQESLVLLSVTKHAVGPCIRVNLPDEQQDLEQYFDTLANLVPATVDGYEPITGVFALIFSGNAATRERQLSPATRTVLHNTDLYIDNRAGISFNQWLPTLYAACNNVHLDLYDVLYCGSVSRWSLDQNQLALTYRGPIEDIMHSSYYLDRVYEGRRVSAEPLSAYTQCLWDTATSASTNEVTEWEQASLLWMHTFEEELNQATGRHTVLEHPGYYRQKSIELCYWESALEAVRWVMRTYPPENAEEHDNAISFGDRLRSLISPEIAGYLLCSMNTQATPEFILYQAAKDLPEALGVLDGYDCMHAACGEGSYEPVEPLCYGKPTTRRRTTLPETFYQTFRGESPRIGGIGHGRVSWHDWIRRTHRILQQQILDDTCDSSETRPEEHITKIDRMVELLSGLTKDYKPAWSRLNALEVLCNLLVHAVQSGEQYGRLRLLQAWINWLRGGNTYAGILADIARLHCDEDMPIFQALSESVFPLWITDPVRCWRGDLYFSTLLPHEAADAKVETIEPKAG